MIGQNALGEIFKPAQEPGDWASTRVARSQALCERLDDTKPYEFGDPFHLDMRKTIMNADRARRRHDAGHSCSPDDFEIYRRSW